MGNVNASPPAPAVIVIFGVTGDLAKNKVLPSLMRLFNSGALHEHTFVVGTSRQAVSIDTVLADLPSDQATNLRQHFSIVQLRPDEDEDYINLKSALQELEDGAGVCLQQFFYLSIPPQVYAPMVHQLGKHGLQHGCNHEGTDSRLLIEKPFGYDTESARQLIATTGEYFKEEQLYRIDHYLAKETAQNILVFRQKNPLFNQIWNNRHITQVSITAAESIDIEGRANFYDQVGALRDTVQSHLIQLLALTLMDLPQELGSDSVHDAKLKVLEDLVITPSNKVTERAVRGQYNGYRQEVQNHESSTETFASLVLFSTNPHWQNVPLKLTAGKALKVKRTSITIDFGERGTNRLQFRLQPNEGITLKLQVKQPGLSNQISETKMDFAYETAFDLQDQLDAYDRVLIDAMRGDRTLFAGDKEVLAAWRVLQPVLDAWQANDQGLNIYEPGSDGPNVEKLTNLTHDN